jgi:glycerol-3-phosphate dehydrogenase
MLADMTKRWLEADVADHLLSLYGSRYEEVLSISEADHQLRERMKPGLPHIWAEVPYSVTHECAVTLEDVMVRRLHLFVEDAEQGLDVASRVVETMASLLGWDEGMKALQLSLYRRLVAESRP